MTYEHDPAAPVPPGTERLGTDAEGRTLYVEPGRASSRKHVFLAAREPPLVGYVRPDPPPELGLADVLGAAFSEPLPRPDALAVLGVLAAKHVVLIDGTRLGGSREVLAEAVATVALEPTGLAAQAARVPDWALVEAARPRWEALTARLLAISWVREVADPDFGFVRRIERRELVLGKTTRDPVDVGQRLVIRSQDNTHGDVLVCVVDVDERDARARQVVTDRDEALAHGDPVYFAPIQSPLPPRAGLG